MLLTIGGAPVDEGVLRWCPARQLIVKEHGNLAFPKVLLVPMCWSLASVAAPSRDAFSGG